MHAGDHRRRSAFLRETFDDGGRAADAKAETAHVRCADGAQEASLAERLHPTFGKHAVTIDVSGIGADDFCTDLFESRSKIRGFWGHAYLAKDTEAACATLRWQPELRLDTVEP
jgi:hypothetical protein